MSAAFVCINCAKVIPREETETHFKWNCLSPELRQYMFDNRELVEHEVVLATSLNERGELFYGTID